MLSDDLPLKMPFGLKQTRPLHLSAFAGRECSSAGQRAVQTVRPGPSKLKIVVCQHCLATPAMLAVASVSPADYVLLDLAPEAVFTKSVSVHPETLFS